MDNNNFHYDDLVNQNIIIAKTLSNLPDNEKNKIKKLLYKKEIIKQKNGLFAEFKINIINKKIKKIREVYNEKK